MDDLHGDVRAGVEYWNLSYSINKKGTVFRQFLYATQGGVDRASHTRRGLWAGPGKFFCFFFYFSFLFFLPFTFFYDSKNVEISKMFRFKSVHVQKHFKI
jgi:hypothetical protein